MPKILVVEDEPSIALGLKTDLRLEGYEVEVAADGETAVRRAAEASFDLILLDLMLPRKDGLTVCRELRRAGNRVPIIMLTAKAQEAEKVLGLELGADDYVTKPFSPVELRARVKAMLRRTVSEDLAACRFGDVEVDFARSQVRRAGRLVEVTPHRAETAVGVPAQPRPHAHAGAVAGPGVGNREFPHGPGRSTTTSCT